jgi:peptide/nickel transport system permease protein
MATAQTSRGWISRAWRGLGAYPMLTVGLVLILAIVLMSLIGPHFVEKDRINVGYALPDQKPSREYLLGTDTVGRQMLAIIIYGTPLTLKVGLIAGMIGLVVGTAFGLISGFYGGIADSVLRGAADAFLTVPGLLVLVVIATTFQGGISITTQALVVSALAWMYPTRTIRSQVLSIRERGYVQLSRFSGMNGAEIITREIVPNLLPYLAASFVGAVSAAILASIGLEALGLGPQNEPTLGMTIYWSMYYTSILRNLWWWFAPPIVVIIIIFMGLFMISAGLDQIANPRLRSRT